MVSIRAWIVQPTEPTPLDRGRRLMRCGQLARLLAEKGHQAVWWNSTFVHLTKTFRYPTRKRIQVEEGYELDLIPGPGYRSNRSLQRIRHNRRFAADFLRLAGKCASKPDLIFCSLPPLESSEAAVSFGKRHGIPVVVDVRDLWPDVYLDHVPPLLRGVGRYMLSPFFRKARRICREADGLTAISGSYLDWALANAGREIGESDRIFPLAYCRGPDSREEIEAESRRLIELGVNPDQFVCCFFGTMGRYYNIHTIISAAKMLQHRSENDIQFVLCGDGERLEEYRKDARGLRNIIFPGWVSSPAIQALMEISSVGLAPYIRGAAMSLPNKPFEYFSRGLPVIHSLETELKDLVERENVGLFYPPEDSDSLLKRIFELRNEPSRRSLMGKRAWELFREKFDSVVVYSSMIEFFESLATSRRSSRNFIPRVSKV